MALDLEQASAIARALGLDEHGLKIAPVAGGDIAASHVLESSDCWVFLKAMPLEQGGLLSAEADGLTALASTNTVRVPRVICRGVHGDRAWLALEYLQLESRSERADAVLGRQLAALHRHTGEHFGWHRNNYIGRTPQANAQADDWTEFFLLQRLGPQFDQLIRAHPDEDFLDWRQAIFAAWHCHHAGHRPQASLVHGDLWHGNAAAIGRDAPVIFDPAVHHADRECDLAMVRLFGGFSPAFHQAYETQWPLPEGYIRRRPFYKLYHVLNHANLFGGAYLESTRELCRRILDDSPPAP